MEALINFSQRIGDFNFPILMFLLQAFIILLIVISIMTLIYDRYIQRDDQLLINYPLIGRMRYLFYALRDPMRQYFGDEKFYESFDKVQWVYDAAEGRSGQGRDLGGHADVEKCHPFKCVGDEHWTLGERAWRSASKGHREADQGRAACSLRSAGLSHRKDGA